jgi:hypothetical protein
VSEHGNIINGYISHRFKSTDEAIEHFEQQGYVVTHIGKHIVNLAKREK